jgi:hypothetical protein
MNKFKTRRSIFFVHHEQTNGFQDIRTGYLSLSVALYSIEKYFSPILYFHFVCLRGLIFSRSCLNLKSICPMQTRQIDEKNSCCTCQENRRLLFLSPNDFLVTIEMLDYTTLVNNSMLSREISYACPCNNLFLIDGLKIIHIL